MNVGFGQFQCGLDNGGHSNVKAYLIKHNLISAIDLGLKLRTEQDKTELWRLLKLESKGIKIELNRIKIELNEIKLESNRIT